MFTGSFCGDEPHVVLLQFRICHDAPSDFANNLSHVAEVAAAMAASISHLHSHGIIHRDIALRNFVLTDKTDQSTAILIDFGLARGVRGNFVRVLFSSHWKCEIKRVGGQKYQFMQCFLTTTSKCGCVFESFQK